MVLTPSTKSGGIAGATFWAMIWGAVSHLDAIFELFHLPTKRFNSKHVFRWVLEHKPLTLICSECINYGIHGLKSSTGVVFALGGTFTNIIVIFFVLPITNKVKGKSWLYGR